MVLRKSCSSSCSPKVDLIFYVFPKGWPHLPSTFSFFNEQNEGMRGQKESYKKMVSICHSYDCLDDIHANDKRLMTIYSWISIFCESLQLNHEPFCSENQFFSTICFFIFFFKFLNVFFYIHNMNITNHRVHIEIHHRSWSCRVLNLGC